MVQCFEDFCDELLKSGFSLGGGSDKGIYAIVPFDWTEQPADTPVRWHTGDPKTDPWEWRMRVLEERLRGRGSEDEETLHHRLVIAREELRRAYDYDYVVINDTVESAVKGIETVIEAENKKTARNKNLISEVIDNV